MRMKMTVRGKELSFLINEQGINFDSILPDIPDMVLYHGEWTEGLEVRELYLGADRTPYVDGIRIDGIEIIVE